MEKLLVAIIVYGYLAMIVTLAFAGVWVALVVLEAVAASVHSANKSQLLP